MTRYKFLLSTLSLLVILILTIPLSMFLRSANKKFNQISTATTLSSTSSAKSVANQEILTTTAVLTQVIPSALAMINLSKEVTVQPLPPPKLSDGSEFGLVVHNPKFSPFSDRYIFTALVNSMPSGLWLASISKGLEKQLVVDQNVGFSWAYDDNHIIYSPMPKPSENPFQPYPPTPQPVILVSLDSGEQKEIGQSTLGWDVASAPTGDIAFMNGDQAEIVNPVSGTKRYVPFALTIGLPPTPVPTPIQEATQTPEKIPDFLLTPAPEELTPLPPDAVPANALACFYPDCQVRIRMSPDGKKLALHQIFRQLATLVIVDIDTQKSIFLTDQISGWYSFDWSPDSTKLAYATQLLDTRTPELWIINSDGSELHQLTFAKGRRGFYEYVTWLPDNNEILYVFTPSGAESEQWAEYQMISVNGGEPSVLFTNGTTIQLFNNGNQIRLFREKHDEQQPYFRNWVAGFTK